MLWPETPERPSWEISIHTAETETESPPYCTQLHTTRLLSPWRVERDESRLSRSGAGARCEETRAAGPGDNGTGHAAHRRQFGGSRNAARVRASLRGLAPLLARHRKAANSFNVRGAMVGRRGSGKAYAPAAFGHAHGTGLKKRAPRGALALRPCAIRSL